MSTPMVLSFESHETTDESLRQNIKILTNFNLIKWQPGCRFAKVSTSVAVSFSRLLGQHSSEPKL